MAYTDAQLEAMATEFENGITNEHLEGATCTPGLGTWLLDVVDDWQAFSAAAAREGLSSEELVHKGLNAYLHP